MAHVGAELPSRPIGATRIRMLALPSWTSSLDAAAGRLKQERSQIKNPLSGATPEQRKQEARNEYEELP